MASPLTERATPAELATREQVIDNKAIIADFPRLVEIVKKELAALPRGATSAQWRHFPVTIKLRFGWADARRELAFVEGEVSARLVARCQRCLEPFDFAVGTAVNWLILPPGCVAPADGGRETWELEDEWLRPLDLVEETLILALPLVAKHEDPTNCRPAVPIETAERGNKVRPFSALRSQWQDSN
jgi:DUF177 domain-containing protein